ncbi:MAG: MFS transporter [Solirubrobacteraceae bacterium]
MKKLIAILCLVQFVDVLGVTEVLSAVPRMLASVAAPAGSASAELTAYAMCFGGLLMIGARLGDRFGHRRMLVGGIAVFAAGSLAAAIAGSVAMLIAGRSLQGAAAAISVPASLRLLIAATPGPADRRAAMSAWSAAGAVAGASGFVVGGAVTQLTGWRAMFWLNLPLALVLAAGVLRVTGERRPARRRRLDLPGGLLFSAGVAGLVLGGAMLEPPGRPGVGLAAVGAGAVLLTAAALVERRARDPLLPPQTLRHPALRDSATAAFLNTATTSSAMAIATLELQRAQHLSPAAAGLRLLPVSLGAIAGATLGAPALRRWTPRAVIGQGLSLIGLADAGLIACTGAGWLVAIPVGAAGAGIGVSSVAANALGTDVGETLQAGAAGTINTAAQLGTALGVAALLLLGGATAHAALPLRGAALGWAAAAAMALVGAAAISPVPWVAAIRDRRSRSAARQRGAPTPGG